VPSHNNQQNVLWYDIVVQFKGFADNDPDDDDECDHDAGPTGHGSGTSNNATLHCWPTANRAFAQTQARRRVI
jgi:hypothetical protein